MESSSTQGASNTAADTIEPPFAQENNARGTQRHQREAEAIQRLTDWANSPQSGQGQRSVVESRIISARESGANSLQLDSLGIESLPPHLDILLPRLKALDLSNNNLTTIPDTLPSLEVLSINDNPLETLPLVWPRSLKKLNFSAEQAQLLQKHAQQLLKNDLLRDIKLSTGEPQRPNQTLPTHTDQAESFLRQQHAVITEQPTSSTQQETIPDEDVLRFMTLLNELRVSSEEFHRAEARAREAQQASCCMKFLACLVLCCTSCCCFPCICCLIAKRRGYTEV